MPNYYQTSPTIPIPSTVLPPSIADASAIGATPSMYALPDHTHASKLRRDRIQCNADGTMTWTYATPFAAGVVPRCAGCAEIAAGITDVVNVQVVDTPTNTQCKLLVNRTNKATVALLGLTILSVPASVGATWVHLFAFEP